MTDNVDYAKKKQGIITYHLILRSSPYYKKWSWHNNLLHGNNQYEMSLVISINLDTNINISNNESRPKTKFFSLLIYAGYPIA